MALDLASARAKVSWAEQHARTLHDELTLWFDKNPYDTVAEANADCTQWVFKIRAAGADEQFRRVALMVGDCLNGLRCALDHAMYAVIVHYEPGADSPYFAFPITNDRIAYADRLKRVGIKKIISAAAYNLIESVQPYNRPLPVDPTRGALTLLRDLNNFDKHRLIHVVNAERGPLDLPIINPDGAKFTLSAPPHTLEDGTELLLVSSDIPAPNVKFQGHLGVGIAIEYGGFPRPVNIPGGITDIIAEVGYILDLIETNLS